MKLIFILLGILGTQSQLPLFLPDFWRSQNVSSGYFIYDNFSDKKAIFQLMKKGRGDSFLSCLKVKKVEGQNNWLPAKSTNLQLAVVVMLSNFSLARFVNEHYRFFTSPKITWLIYSFDANLEQRLKLPINSQFFTFAKANNTYVIDELYQIQTNMKIIRRQVGFWKDSEKFKIEENWVDRRRDLQGVEFKCTTEIDPPYTDFYVDNGLVQVSGYIGDAWNELKDIMNFT